MDNLVRYQVRLQDKAKGPHVLALRTIYAQRIVKPRDWVTIHASLNKVRGNRIDLGCKLNRSASKPVVAWIKDSPILHEWAMSDKCLRSPASWPVEVLPAFQHRLIPTPHDICNLDMMQKYAYRERPMTCHMVALLYGMGFSLLQIARGYGMSRNDIIQMLYAAIEAWQTIPQYLIWASATDFRRAFLPSAIHRLPIKKRSRFLAALLSNPFYADTLYCEQLLQNPAYLKYLILGSPKKLRLSSGCRVYRTREEVYVEKDQQQ